MIKLSSHQLTSIITLVDDGKSMKLISRIIEYCKTIVEMYGKSVEKVSTRTKVMPTTKANINT